MGNTEIRIMAEKIKMTVEQEKCASYRERLNVVEKLKQDPSEENLWYAVAAFQDCAFKTATGLPFRYHLRKGKNGSWTRELWVDRRENSKSITWSSIRLAFQNSLGIEGVVERPKALGDIRGISYIYPIFWRFGLIKVPEKAEKQMKVTEDGQVSFENGLSGKCFG